MAMMSALFMPWSETLEVRDVSPPYHEVGILTGYRRQNQPWIYYMRSLFHLHNETFNVWTHLLGSAIFIVIWWYYVSSLDAVSQSATQLINIYVICSITANLTSAGVHLLHSKSYYFHYCATLTDYIGVSMYPFATAMLQLYICAHRQVYLVAEKYFIPLNVFLGWMTFLSISLVKLTLEHPSQRLKRKVLQTGSTLLYLVALTAIILPRYIACYSDVFCEMSSLSDLSIVFVCLLLMGVMYSALFPEKYCSGYFDIIGHSHQWFHVLGTLVQILQLRAAILDFKSGSTEIAIAISRPDIRALVSSLVILLILDIVTLAVIAKFVIPKKVGKKRQ